MQIEHIKIENYRSIKSLDLAPGQITALVGSNNAGKTNILSALNFLLGDRFPMIQGLDDKDFFNKSRDNGLLIKVWFHTNEHHIRSVWFELNATTGQGEARFNTTTDERPKYLSNEIRKNCAMVYLDASRNFDSQFGSSRWALFGQIIRQLDSHFRTEVSEDVQMQVREHLERAQDLLKTDLYRSFETAVAESFQEQVRRTSHTINFDFRTFDPLNFYRSLQPVLLEDGITKSPAEAGSGMRNLIVMALFRAYARAFRGDALIVIEEPEIYMHPHAQRSLAALFRELADQGAQIFYSTHSASFLSIENFDELALVDRRPDEDGDICTKISRLTANDLVAQRQQLHPTINITIPSLRERLRSACGIEHAEAFFATVVVLVEGETERAALPIYAKSMGVDLDALGVSIVSAGGKAGLDALYQLYQGIGRKVFLLFDNDRGGENQDLIANRTLTRLIRIDESDNPVQVIQPTYGILEPDFEGMVRRELEVTAPGRYDAFKGQAQTFLGTKAGKPLVARFIATKIVEQAIIPATIRSLIEAIQQLVIMEPQENEDQTASDVFQ